MKRIILFFIFLPLFFSSCSDENIPELYSSGNYSSVFDLTTKLCAERFDEESLYYKAMSANRLGYIKDSVDAASLYIMLYSKPSDEKIVMERIVLHYGSPAMALNAGELLESETALSKEDSIQLYKVLNDNKLYSRANFFLDKLYTSLSTIEYVFCMINGGAPVDRIVRGLEELYNKEDISENFLSAMRLFLPTISASDDISTVTALINKTFDGNSRYALILGDYYYNLGIVGKMRYYWTFASKDFPEAVDTRLKIAGVNE